MTELFYDGYSEYELEALKIPPSSRGKCLAQLVDFTRCQKKAGVFESMFNDPCEDQYARFARCHQPSVNYYSAGHLARMKFNNPSAFEELKVSPTLQAELFNCTPLAYHR